MLLDAEQGDGAKFKDVVFDVCIVGAGPAGITLARKLADKGWTVALCEAGGFDQTLESQEFYEGDIVGRAYVPLDSVRLRFFGGTSNHWVGYCRELDDHDFEPRPHHPLSGWPITKADLDPYARETHQILDLKPMQKAWAPSESPPGTFHRIGYFKSAPTRFGQKYRKQIENSPKISLLLHANLVDITLRDDLKAVSELTFRTYTDETPFKVRARYYVLCMGGLENTRILLNTNHQVPAGIGNEHDLVGRYFCEHPEMSCGSAVLQTRILEVDFYAATPELLDAEKSLNFSMVIVPLAPDRPWTKQIVRDAVCTNDFTENLTEAVFGSRPDCLDAEVRVQIEQGLNPDSRVYLVDKRDRFGLREIALDWRLNDLDIHTYRAAVMSFGAYLADTNLGRVQVAEWLRPEKPVLSDNPADIELGFHQICTTRMSDDPKTGVVDRDCRIHGIDDLYIGGGSVFATAGFTNPTYTVVQLALRMSDHLHARLSAGGTG